MRRFLDDPERILDFGRASRTLAEQRYDVRKINRRMLTAMRIATPTDIGSADD